ncbi:MAG: glycine cleavage system protein GcvH [Gammaproteobacteria bacterium]|nr:MAG: glycine cleavage system protein GcvH [Gammaproteobacteria bacterium]
MVPTDLLYNKSHEWIQINDNDEATIGISHHAAELLGDIVFIELPSLDDEVKIEDDIAVIESVKTASDLYAPLSGKIIAVNQKLEDNPETINEDPYGEGWIMKIKINNKDEVDDLLKSAEYQASIEED